jgi:predicted glycoside hydrolase/deacetylase ChbG (UPF0249 family)
MKKLLSLMAFLVTLPSIAQQPLTLAERMGYSETDKLLVIHADDIGMAHSENVATIHAIKAGVVNSTSIMMPCAWSTEVGELIKDMPNFDIGVHITLTNEWHTYKWGPVASKSEVPGLVGPDGFMYKDCASVAKNASPEEVEKEMRAQIEAALKIGIKPTHLDSHMGCVFFGRPEYLVSYLKLAKEYGFPAMVNRQMMEGIIRPNAALFKGIEIDKIPVIDHVAIASEKIYEEIGLDEYYTRLLKDLQPGVTVLLNHIAFDDDEMQALTTRFSHWHARWRQEDFDFFTSKKAKDLLAANNIKLVTWREIGQVK